MTEHKSPGFLTKWKNFGRAFWEFLRRPKTVFDLKDRLRALLLFILLCLFCQMVVHYFQN
jgi:hypothetical protein